MKTLYNKTLVILLFFIANITSTAQNNIITNQKNNEFEQNQNITEATPPHTPTNKISFVIEDTEKSAKLNGARAIVNLQIDKEPIQGMSYQLYNNFGKLIKSNPINKTNTIIHLHNKEAENYVLNIVKGNENIQTFGFYH